MSRSDVPRRLVLKKDLARTIRTGHPWIWRDALDGLDGLEPGTVVDVGDRDGTFVARAYADPGSPIGARVLTLEAAERVDDAFIGRRVAEAAALRRRIIDVERTTAYRLIHGEGDFLPGVVCDAYGDVYVLRFDGAGARAFGRRVVPHIERAASVIERSREGSVHLAGLPAPEVVTVREHGIQLAVDVLRGQKTGLFLDQRENRRLVRDLARGRSVLNCFAYTGGFSVAAALGGATRTISVDTARPALAMARRNFELNGLDPAAHAFAGEDVFRYLDESVRRGERHGLVILDPPSFAPSARTLPRALAAYRDLNVLGFRAVEPGGLLATASCSSHVSAERFIETVEEAARAAGRRIRLLDLRGAGPDHPVAPGHPEGRYLKFLLVGVI